MRERRVGRHLLVLLVAVGLLGLPEAAAQPDRDTAPDVAPAARPGPAAADRDPVRPGELIVKTAPGRNPAFAVAGVGGRVRAALGRRTQVVEVAPGQEHVAAQRLSDDPAVVYAEPNYVRSAAGHRAAGVPWGVRRVRADLVWPDGVTGAGVRVAVLDSGVQRVPALAGRVVGGFDAYRSSGKGWRDDCGHGTAVAGIVAAAREGGGPTGVAPGATIVPVRVLRFDEFFGACVGDDAAIVRGLRWAVSRGDVDVVNLSLSGPQPSRALADAVQEAVAAGVLVVAASGNSGDRTVNYPAGYANVVSVGGVGRTSSGLRWWRPSSFGKVDVAAPAKGVPILDATHAVEPIGRPCPARDGHHLCADGTSFAAPHVAGAAALLFEHNGLAAAAPGARLRRLRQWLLATSPGVAGVRRGVSLHVGHGMPDARAAVDASDDADQVLLTWRTPARVLAPTTAMRAMAAARRLVLVATDGTGAPLVGRQVRLTVSSGRLSETRATVSGSGRVATVLRSRAGGRRILVTADVAGRSLPVEAYVLQRDDNTPGVRLRPSGRRGRLTAAYDFDDVSRVWLAAGETLRAAARGVDGPREFVDLYLHRGATRDVTNPRLAPLAERGAAFRDAPTRLRVRVNRRGRRYLDAFGRGTYRLVWWISSPGKVSDASATPRRFSPDGDGRADRTVIRWRVARRGRVVLQLRNRTGRVVHTARLGTLSRGRKAYRWDGRNDRGRVVRNGPYRVRVRWFNGKGRRSLTSTRVVVDR